LDRKAERNEQSPKRNSDDLTLHEFPSPSRNERAISKLEIRNSKQFKWSQMKNINESVYLEQRAKAVKFEEPRFSLRAWRSFDFAAQDMLEDHK
jgi:hypothetical protein